MIIGALFVLVVAACFLVKSIIDTDRRQREAEKAEAEAERRNERALGLY
jgi:hypothetical protein